jgi:hypothetical protein
LGRIVYIFNQLRRNEKEMKRQISRNKECLALLKKWGFESEDEIRRIANLKFGRKYAGTNLPKEIGEDEDDYEGPEKEEFVSQMSEDDKSE